MSTVVSSPGLKGIIRSLRKMEPSEIDAGINSLKLSENETRAIKDLIKKGKIKELVKDFW